MEIRNPILLIIGILIIIVIPFIFKRKKQQYNIGTKIANTKFLKENSYYQAKIKKYKKLTLILKATCIIAMITSTILLARISKIEKVDSTEYNRDIFLCMDASSSVDELNLELVSNLKDTVKSLKGERLGISIFNTSSIVLVPLTDDYNYILDTLDNLEKSLKQVNSEDYDIDDYLTSSNYLMSGTLEGADTRGSSLIGDGLASCVFSFPNLEEERTRIIIFSTDNDLAGTPIVTLEEAANISKNKNVIVYGIGTEYMYEKNRTEFKNAVLKTNGEYYDFNKNSGQKIINSIEKQSKSLLKEDNKTYMVDFPQIPFLILLISIIILFIIERKVII